MKYRKIQGESTHPLFLDFANINLALKTKEKKEREEGKVIASFR